MLSKSLQLNSLSIVRYGSSFVLGLVLCTASAPVLGHVGHDNEFAGGDAAKIMQPIKVDANKATALGIKTQAIAPTTDGGILKIPSTSLIDANGQKLVYIQEGTTYKPISVQIGTDSGDVVEIKEGNLVPGNQIVMQGATLLYSEALRGKPPAETQASPATSPATSQASAATSQAETQASPATSPATSQASAATSQAETQPAQGSSPLMWVAGAGVLLVGGFALFGLKGKDR